MAGAGGGNWSQLSLSSAACFCVLKSDFGGARRSRTFTSWLQGRHHAVRSWPRDKEAGSRSRRQEQIAAVSFLLLSAAASCRLVIGCGGGSRCSGLVSPAVCRCVLKSDFGGARRSRTFASWLQGRHHAVRSWPQDKEAGSRSRKQEQIAAASFLCCVLLRPAVWLLVAEAGVEPAAFRL